MDEGEALVVQPAGVDRRADACAVDEDLAAGSAPVDPADQLDQGGLARAVLPHEGVDLAGREARWASSRTVTPANVFDRPRTSSRGATGARCARLSTAWRSVRWRSWRGLQGLVGLGG